MAAKQILIEWILMASISKYCLSLYEIPKNFFLIEKISTPNRSMKEPEFKERIIHNFQVLPSMGFNASHSAVENVVVITGKLIPLPYGLESRSEF